MSNINTLIAAARANRIATQDQAKQPSTSIAETIALKATTIESHLIQAASDYLDLRNKLKADRIAAGCRW